MSKVALDKIGPDLESMGLKLTLFYIENISLPPEVEEALDKRTKMGVIGDLHRYTEYQTAEAIPVAAANPGGMAGAGMGLAAGMAMGNQMAGQLAGAAAGGPPPLPAAVGFYLGIGGQREGPYDADRLAAKAREGALTRDTLVWRQGMANWIAAGSVPELAAVLAAVPPPLPPK